MKNFQKILDLLRFWKAPNLKNTTVQKINLDLKQNSEESLKENSKPLSIKDLEKVGLAVQKIKESDSVFKKTGKEKLIYAGQLPQHVFPWAIGMSSGLYLVKFPSNIQAQINSGILNVTGGVARNSSGEIIKHATPASLLSISPIILYQVGVIAFGAYHLKKINESLEKINKKLSEIFAFQLDKRTAQINSHFQEFGHISKGIFEFQEKGNIEEILKRVDMIKSIRLMNLSNLLHLQKNVKDKEGELKNSDAFFSFGTEEEAKLLMNLVESFERDVTDYQKSLLLNIVLTKTELTFSICKSYKEAESRISAQKKQLEFLKNQSHDFGKLLNRKVPELIDSIWNSEETIEQRRREVRASWRALEKFLNDCHKLGRTEIQSIENIITDSQDNIVFLKTGSAKKEEQANNSDHKKTA